MENEVHANFLGSTGKMWTSLSGFCKSNKYPYLPFRCSDLRDAALKALGSKEDGFVRCYYCRGFWPIEDLAFDFVIPLSRGGSQEIVNTEFLCKTCHKRKGLLTPEEYSQIIKIGERKMSHRRKDMLERLENNESSGEI